MIDHASTETEQAQVKSWLREFNQAENGEFMASLADGAEQAFFLVSRDAEGGITGGLQGVILHSWLKIELMAVCPDERDRGIGRRLVTEAEKLGIQSGCQYAYVDTMSFQAPAFYGHLGYTESGRLKDWDSHGHDKIFFTKRLATESKGERGSLRRLLPEDR